MKKTFFAILTLVVAVMGGLLIYKYPISLLFVIENNVWKLSFWLLIGVIGFVLVILKCLKALLVSLLRGLKQMKAWWIKNRLRKRKIKFRKGILAALNVDFLVAERCLKRLKFNDPEEREFKNLVLSTVYRQLGQYDQGLTLLDRSVTLESKLAKINLWLSKKDFLRAEPFILSLYKQYTNHSAVIKVLANFWFQQKEWEKLRRLLPALYKKKVFDRSYLTQLEEQVYSNLLLKQVDFQKFWKKLPRYLRNRPTLLAVYVELLFKQGNYADGEILLVKRLNQKIDESLLRLYLQIKTNDPIKWLEQAEKWLKNNPHNSCLLLVLGQICLKQRFYAKAHSYFLGAQTIQPTLEGYIALSEVLVAEGHPEQALLIFEQLKQLI